MVQHSLDGSSYRKYKDSTGFSPETCLFQTALSALHSPIGGTELHRNTVSRCAKDGDNRKNSPQVLLIPLF